jgi:hypothetical protein
MSNSTLSNSPRARTVAGVALLSTAALSVVAMLHHPTAHGHDAASVVRSLLDVANLSAHVHGGLIAMLPLSSWAMLEFSIARGLHRAPVRAALALYWVGTIAMLAAGLINGFVISRVAAYFSAADAAAQAQGHALFALTWAMNQTAAVFAVLVHAAAIVLWSLGLTHERGTARLLGIAGLLAGIGCAGALLLHGVKLDVTGMLWVAIVQSAWQAGVGLWLIRQTSSQAWPSGIASG